MSAEEKKFLSGCGCYMRFEQKVIHSLDELRKSRPCPISERVCTFSLGLFNSPFSPQQDIPVVVNPDVVEPDVDYPDLEKPRLENPAQLNT